MKVTQDKNGNLIIRPEPGVILGCSLLQDGPGYRIFVISEEYEEILSQVPEIEFVAID